MTDKAQGPTYAILDPEEYIESSEEDALLPTHNKSLKRGAARSRQRLRRRSIDDDDDSSQTKIVLIVITSIVAAILCLTVLLLLKSSSGLKQKPRLPGLLVKGDNGAVAAEIDICSDIGIDMLQLGGSATDATIASLLCVGTINAFATGIGGGGFGIVKDADDKDATAIDFREEAPFSSHKNMYLDDPHAAQKGPRSVGVPGEIRGMQVAHARFGRISWKQLFEPTIKLARNGFVVRAELAKRLQKAGDLFKDPVWAAVYTNNGTIMVEGDIIRRPTLANTLETIANDGADVFYTGKIAETLVDHINTLGGNISLTDFSSYRALLQPAMSTFYHGRQVWTTPGPTSGPSLLAMLNILEGYPFMAHGLNGLNYHRLVEAQKYGYAFRTELGDPAYTNNSARIDEFLSKEYATEVRGNISDSTTFPVDYYQPRFDIKNTHGTTHVSAIDKYGSVASFTSTVNLFFGSGIMEPKTGIILNDEMDDFSIPGIPNAFNLYPSPYNYPVPHKRPLSSCVPAIVMQASGHPVALGASGGSRILTAVLQAILNVVDHGMDLSAAVEYPRVHCQLLPEGVMLESSLPHESDVLRELRERNHNVTVFDINNAVSEVQAVAKWWDGKYHGASDSRKHGIAAAY